MFMAFPLNSKPDWRNPPWLTLLLILINCIVYFGPQRSEERAWTKAAAYYAESALAPIEVPRYIDYLRASGDKKRSALADAIAASLKHRRPTAMLRFMETDSPFQAALHDGRIVPREDPDYALWHEQRTRFDELKGAPFTARWASNPADWKPVSLLTATFLHGSVGHLVGNMIFLFLFGYTVEVTLGRARYLAFYLIAGICGEFGDLIARWGSTVIGLGASGAISGLMAMYVALYGRRKIQFFYQFLFYFDYVKAPAIILLPAWIGHEFLQHSLNPESGVANMAHAGGLISGALLIAWHKWRHPQTTVALPEPAPDDGFRALKARADKLVQAMDLDAARDAYRRLVKLRPQHREVLVTLFNLGRLAPASEEFHYAAARIFSLPETDPATEELVYESFKSYWSAAKPRPHLSADTMAKLAVRLARTGHVEDAEQLGSLLVHLRPDHPRLPAVLLALVQGELQRNRRDRAAAHGLRLKTEHADSVEARYAAGLLA